LLLFLYFKDCREFLENEKKSFKPEIYEIRKFIKKKQPHESILMERQREGG
jgi:hypothetical protein